jgi:purine-binding chemotaxis protein CheW
MAEVGHTADGRTLACLVFRAGELLAALRLADVVETMRPLAVRAVAGTAAHLPGLTIMRGEAAPVVDLALLLTGRSAAARRFVAARTPRGPVALATGEVLGVRAVAAGPVRGDAPLLGAVAARLVDVIGFLDDEPVFVLRAPGAVPDEVWAEIAAAPAEPVAVP